MARKAQKRERSKKEKGNEIRINNEQETIA